jgi:hypothetical protein
LSSSLFGDEKVKKKTINGEMGHKAIIREGGRKNAE